MELKGSSLAIRVPPISPSPNQTKFSLQNSTYTAKNVPSKSIQNHPALLQFGLTLGSALELENEV